MTVRNDGWAIGTAYGFTFQALVFSEPSENGINNGRVSKLFMLKEGQPVLTYDRKWKKEAACKMTLAISMKLLSALEELPS